MMPGIQFFSAYYRRNYLDDEERRVYSVYARRMDAVGSDMRILFAILINERVSLRRLQKRKARAA